MKNYYDVHILDAGNILSYDNICHILNPAEVEVMYLIVVILCVTRVETLQTALLLYTVTPRVIKLLLDV